MAERDVLHRVAARAVVVFALSACATPGYSPCPVDLDGPLPASAFARCREVLANAYGPLAIADEEPLRLQTGWVECVDPPGERRASVFVDAGGLAVVVELRWLRESLLGLPTWSDARGDASAERELAEALREALRN